MNEKNDPTRLGRERIGKLLFEFALPAVFGMLFNTLYNVIDTAFLQYALGDTGAAVATLAMPIMQILMGISMLAGMGGCALASIQMGEGKHDKVELTLGNTVLLLVLMGALVALVGHLAMPLLLAFISTPEVLHESTAEFLLIICSGFIFQSLGMGVNNFLRTAGKPIMAFVTMAIGTVLCIVFNYIFVLQFNWGVAGSAYATIIGQGCGMVPVMWYFMFSKNAPFRLRVQNLSPKPRLMGRILVMGLASFLMQVGSTCVSLVFNYVIGIWSIYDAISPDSAFAAIGIAQKATMMVFAPMIGLLQANQPIIGFNFGAKQWDRVLQALKLGTFACMAIGGVFTVLAFAIPDQLVSLFGIKGDSEVLAAQSLMIYSIFLCPVGYQIMCSSYFQSSGQPAKSSVLELTRQVIFLTPLLLILPYITTQLFGWSGCISIVACAPISDLLSICVTSVFVVHEVRKLRKWRSDAAQGLPTGPDV